MESRCVCILFFFCLFNVPAIKLFEKHNNKKIFGQITASYPAEGAFDCEELCLEREESCDAVNVIYANGRYFCDVMALIPNTTQDGGNMMISNPNGKLIIKTRDVINLCTEQGTECEASSTFENNTCERAIDGETEFGDGKEWVAAYGDETSPWINVTFRQWAELVKVELWARCSRMDQGKRLVLEFSDRSKIAQTLQCSNNTNWRVCPEPVPFIEHVLSPAKTSKWVKLTLHHPCVRRSGRKGIREVKYFGKFVRQLK